MFLACMFSYVIRTNLSITIVAMVNATSKNGTVGPLCTANSLTSNKTTELKDVIPLKNSIFFLYFILSVYVLILNEFQYGERYEWNQHIQGLLLSGYFYGVLSASVPAGLLAEKYGGSKVVA